MRFRMTSKALMLMPVVLLAALPLSFVVPASARSSVTFAGVLPRTLHLHLQFLKQ